MTYRWRHYWQIHMSFRKNHQLRILYGVIGAFKGWNREKTTPNEEEKSALSPRQCAVSQVNHNNGQIARIALWIASSSTVFSASGSQLLLPVYWSKTNVPEKEIWLQWRCYCRNWIVFWGQKWIFLQKGYQNVKEALEWMYHSWRRLCWWMKSNFA